MNKISLILLFLLLFKASPGQSFAHFVGIGAGYTDPYSLKNNVYNYKGDFEINYLTAFKIFCAKFKVGFQPFTYFGLKYRGFISLGLSSPLKNNFSAHLLYGMGGTYATNPNPNGTSRLPNYGQENTENSLELGLNYKPFKDKRFIIGVDAYAWGEYIQEYYRGGSNWSINLTFLATFYFKLNKEKREAKTTKLNSSPLQ